MSWTQKKIQQTLKEIQVQVSTDKVFRNSFKANPNAAIEELSGIKLPDGFRINVQDANEADLTIVLPKTKNDELSDSDLEVVAGGKDNLGTIIGGAAASVAAVAVSAASDAAIDEIALIIICA